MHHRACCNSSSQLRRAALCCLVALGALFTTTFAQEKFDYEAERQKALQMVEANNLIGALPILEKLATAKPDDTKVLQSLALALIATGVAQADEEARVKTLLRARSLAQKAKDLGDESKLVQTILEKVPANLKAEPVKRTPAGDALVEGERAFGKGDMEAAIAAYEKAAKLDPQLYEAPLFIGDAYFKMKQLDKAGQAYARAIAIAPDRETAYRYWGNVLAQSGRLPEARDKLIDAIIAEPYNRATWQFLAGWAQRSNAQLGHPRIQIPQSSVQRKDDKNIDIFVNPTDKQDGSEAWMSYSLTRAAWMTGKRFAEVFPNEKEYRHSLREEAEALRMAAESVANQIKEGKLQEQALDVSIANLLKLHRAGLLEAYVLLAIPDAGIARDYAEYRQANRAKLRQYLLEQVIANK